MKHRVCSYDMVAVPDQAFVLKDPGGEMYFCNLRCLCIWAVQLATHPGLSQIEVGYELVEPDGRQERFEGIVEVARWAAKKALGAV